MISHQNWKPDTCDCIVEEEYDTDTPEMMTCSRVIRKCVDHTNIADNALYGVLYSNPDGENKRKNQVERTLLGYDGINLNLQETRTNPDGSTYITFKNGIKVSWVWSGTGADRILQVTVTGVNLTANQKNQIITFCNTKFGINKVQIV